MSCFQQECHLCAQISNIRSPNKLKEISHILHVHLEDLEVLVRTLRKENEFLKKELSIYENTYVNPVIMTEQEEKELMKSDPIITMNFIYEQLI